MNAGRTMRIGEVAERTSLSLRTLRHYDDVELVAPSARSDAGYRLYTERDVERLLIIRRMKPLGYSLDEMRELLRVIDAIAAGDDGLRARLDEIRAGAVERRRRLAEQLGMADEFVAKLDRL